MKRVIIFALAALFLVSCRAPAVRQASVPLVRVDGFVETRETGVTAFVMPQSGVRLVVRTQPMFSVTDIRAAEVGQSEFGPTISLQLDPEVVAGLAALARSGDRLRLVLVLDGRPIALRRIDRTLTTDRLIFLPEMTATDIAGAVAEINRAVTIARRQVTGRSRRFSKVRWKNESTRTRPIISSAVA